MVEYTNHVYKPLIETYPTWSELKTYITSVEGGLLHISDENEEYCIIRAKHHTIHTMPHVRWFRSTVWNKTMNRPVSVAPPNVQKQLPYQHCQEIVDAELFCQEFFDGFMINCFIMSGSDDVHITSRSKLDATGHFYSSKTFRELFLEACGDLGELIGPDASKQEVSVSYSFLVQHKEHRVVTPIIENRTRLIQKATVMNDGSVIIEDRFETWNDRPNIPTIPLDPTMEFGEWLTQYFQGKTWEFQGVVLKDAQGNRWRFRNESYMAVKGLRGNSENHLERFAQLYVKNSIEHYLHYYPLDSYTFVCNNVFMNMIHQTVYNYYVQLHITKTIAMDDIDVQYRRHVWALHTYYLTVLRPQHKKITYKEVAYYFFQLPWHTLAYLLRMSQDSYFSLMSDVVNQ